LAYDNFDVPIIIDLADIYFETDFVPYQNEDRFGYVFYFLNENPIYSYLEVNAEEKIIKTIEKKVISNRASAGVYCFPSISTFIKSITYSIENKEDLTFNNLHYICPLINYLIKAGIKTTPVKVSEVFDLKNHF
jgi:dTDP-glucose pyrophosphorylase